MEKIISIILAIVFLVLILWGIRDFIAQFKRSDAKFKLFTVIFGIITLLGLALTHNLSFGSIYAATLSFFLIIWGVLNIKESIAEAHNYKRSRGVFLLISNLFPIGGIFLGLVIMLLILLD